MEYADVDYRSYDPANYTYSRGMFRRRRSADCTFSPLELLAEINFVAASSRSRGPRTRNMPFATLAACSSQVPRRRRH